MSNPTSTPVGSLYVHVPFCAQKCVYCAFYSEASSGELVNRYVAALVRELEMVAGDLRPETVFFGGGTPSLLNIKQWETIFRAMERCGLLGAREFTIESNPATVSADKAKLFRDFGVNRVSMGVQSLDENLLDRLGRIHSRQTVFKSFDILRRAGFDNLNLDLMFAIPTQTREIWADTLTEAIAMQSEHLSSYEVIYEDDTPLFHQLQAGEFSVDEDLACAMYDALIDRATEAGFQQYEIANFARHQADPVAAEPTDINSQLPSVDLAGRRCCAAEKLGRTAARPYPRESGSNVSGKVSEPGAITVPSRACRHNVNYWRGGCYYGLGPSATGYVRGVRTKNWSNTQLYCEQLEAGRRAIESREELPPPKRAGEIAAFGLRMNAGWPFETFQRVTQYDLRQEWGGEMHELTERGWAVRDADVFRLTREGLRFADAAAEMFLR